MKKLFSLSAETLLVDVKPRVLRSWFLETYCALFPEISRAKAEAYIGNGDPFFFGLLPAVNFSQETITK